MTFEQFAKDMYYENRNERRDYGIKNFMILLRITLKTIKSFLMDIYRKHYGG